RASRARRGSDRRRHGLREHRRRRRCRDAVWRHQTLRLRTRAWPPRRRRVRQQEGDPQWLSERMFFLLTARTATCGRVRRVTEQRALLVVDVQRGFEDPALGPRDNPDAEENVAKLIAAWRRRGDPIVIVQHDWSGGPLERGTPGFELKEAVSGEAALRIVKTVHSSFHGD